MPAPADREQARFNIRLSPADEHTLDALAASTGIGTRAEIIRLALRFLLANWPGTSRAEADHGDDRRA